MGQFANTLFRMLLGWVQNAAASLWALITDADASAWLRYLADNWLPLTLLLCLGGMAVDFLVYLLRWQPYRVWGGFLRRMRGKEQEATEDAAEQPVFQRRWIYADGSTEVEEVRTAPQEVMPLPEERLDAPIRPTRRIARRSTLEQAYHQPVYPPQWQHDEHPQGENE